MASNERALLRNLFDAAVRKSDPFQAVLRNLPDKPRGRCIVIGAGKAAASMAAAVDTSWPDVALSGIVVTRYGHSVPAGRIRVLEASHPVPDDASRHAAVEIMDVVRGLDKDDLVLALISGGGSSLLVAPAGSMTISDKQIINQELLASGASIGEINTVRKHLSAIKGGRLAQAARPARLVTLVVSDVPGDDPHAVASGPTVGDPSTIDEVRDIIDRYSLNLPQSARIWLAAHPETPKPDDVRGDVRVIIAPNLSLLEAADAARRSGIEPLILSDAIEGEAKEVGRVLAGISHSASRNGLPLRAPALILSGGEATVSLNSETAGRGGRNTELSLSLAIHLNSSERVWAIAADTDGIDGTEDAAGAIVTPDTLLRARNAGLNPSDYLRRHDSYSFFNALGDLVRTGPTLTNVNDFRAVLIR